MLLKIILIAATAALAVVMYSAAVAAGRADRKENEVRKIKK